MNRIETLPLAAFCCAALALPAAAQCGGNAESVFNCTVSGGKKQINVCYRDGQASYLFGKPGREAELELTEPIESLRYLPWNGIGRSIYEEVSFTNGDYTYAVFSAFDRLLVEEDEPLTGGVVVTKGDQTVADLRCDRGTVSHSLDYFYEEKQAVGQCWDYRTFTWTSDCPVN